MLDWDHNAYYHSLLLRYLPAGSRRVLDVGCGAGMFAGELAERVQTVDAIDRSPEMIERAQASTPGNVRCILGDVASVQLPADEYDAVFSISALHHMDLEIVLPRIAACLRPGGVLAAIALPRRDLTHELPAEIAAAIGHRLLGAMFTIRRRLGLERGFPKGTESEAMPVVMDPPLTTRQVASLAGRVLPGSQVKRLVYWRYLMVWRKPVNEHP
jgi:SAM-dependent methyltransferase